MVVAQPGVDVLVEVVCVYSWRCVYGDMHARTSHMHTGCVYVRVCVANTLGVYGGWRRVYVCGAVVVVVVHGGGRAGEGGGHVQCVCVCVCGVWVNACWCAHVSGLGLMFIRVPAQAHASPLPGNTAAPATTRTYTTSHQHTHTHTHAHTLCHAPYTQNTLTSFMSPRKYRSTSHSSSPITNT